MVALAFVVPLAFLVRSTAEDRAIDAARADAAAVVPALISGATQAGIESAAGATGAGRSGRMTIMTTTGLLIGPAVAEPARLEAALTGGASAIGEVEGGVEVVTAVATAPGQLSAIRVFVPDEMLHRGQTRAWSALAFVAVMLVGISVVVADRLSRSIVVPAQHLAAAARRLGDGDLETRVDPEGPPELVELSTAFNQLGLQVSSMLEHERELVAELSHRLRTPLTKLRMRIESVDDATLAGQLRADTDDLTSVVNSLIEEARSTLTRQPGSCDAAAVVTAQVEYWSALAEDQERPMSYEVPTDHLPVGVAENDLRAAVDVLIENVFSHTDDGTPFVVGARRDGSQVWIWVGDAGPGFGSDALQRGTSGSGSTGLGLDIARTTVESCGGSFEVGTSRLGGTEVRMRFPMGTRR